MSIGGVIRKRPLNSSSKEKVQYAWRQTNQGVYIEILRQVTTELIVACSSWRQWATPYHTEALWTADTTTSSSMKRMRRHQRQRQSRQNSQRQLQQYLCLQWKENTKILIWPTKSDRCSLFTPVDGCNCFAVWTNGQFQCKVLVFGAR